MNHHVAEEEKEHTHVLIIGNGFDLEHGLKTDYLSFLKYLEEKDKSREKKESESNLWYGHFLHLLELNRSEEALWCGFEQEIGEAIVELNKLIGELERIKLSVDIPIIEVLEQRKNLVSICAFIKNFTPIQKQLVELKEQLTNIKLTIRSDDKFCKLIECFREKVYKIYEKYIKRELQNILEEGQEYKVSRANRVKIEIESEQLKKDLIKCSFYDLLCVSQELLRYVAKEYDKVAREETSELQKVCKGKIKLMVLDFNYTRIFERSYVPEKDQLKLKKSKFKLDRVLSDMNLSGPIKICYIHGNVISRFHGNWEYSFCVNLTNASNNEQKESPLYKFVVFGCSKFKDEDSIDELFDCYTKDNQRKKEEDITRPSAGENYETIIYKDFSDELDELKESQNITFHIIGHSLGETDHDILTEVLGVQNACIRVYYHNEEAHCRLKENMIHIIGEEAVKDETRVKFICQYDPQEGVFPSRCFKYWVNIG